MFSGGPGTVIDAVAWLPVPPLVEVTLPVVLTLVPPPATALTVTVTVQLAEGANVPPLRLKLWGLTVAVPPQVLVAPLGTSTFSPKGMLSVTATPVSVTAGFGLLMVSVKLVVEPTASVVTPNALVIDGGATTVIEAFEVLPGPPWVDVT